MRFRFARRLPNIRPRIARIATTPPAVRPTPRPRLRDLSDLVFAWAAAVAMADDWEAADAEMTETADGGG